MKTENIEVLKQLPTGSYKIKSESKGDNGKVAIGYADGFITHGEMPTAIQKMKDAIKSGFPFGVKIKHHFTIESL